MAGNISPILWESQPFGNPDAWTMFLGVHQQAHHQLARIAGVPDIQLDDLRTEMGAHDLIHDKLAKFFGLSQTDLGSSDLTNEQEYYVWMLTHSLTHYSLHIAAGI